ncbi:uncharacterized protein LOC122662645 [Telopea speciosissima]|uniref:uncharacterized protein LOC122662645 n=1 Tax=Telopea speciosissima TaxID=54955 RepID=UPI001CC80E17|nr:uncharacterized protein LOC122662645 [Telopea speciosissima]
MESENRETIVGTSAGPMEESLGKEMDSETTATQTTALPEPLNRAEELRGLLTLARQLINQGKPSLALQAVIMAMRTDGGEDAVFHTLHRARELYRNKVQANAAADELASLFAECAIAEAQPLKLKISPFDSGGSSMTPDLHGSSILAKTGREQIMLDACSDGSSFICLQCGGLVSQQRREEHFAYWCCKI